MLAEEAPKVTDWMQAWGSLAGLVMSTAAVIFTGLLFRHEIRVRREEQRDNEAAQARLVVTHPVRFSRNSLEKGRQWALTHAYGTIDNYSGAPVLNVAVRVIKQGEAVGIEDAKFPVLADNVQWGVELVKPIDRGKEDPLPEDHLPEIEFTDAGGLRWKRLGNDLPVRVLPEIPDTVSKKRARTVQVISLVAGAAAGVIINLFFGNAFEIVMWLVR
ncbi:hypothetical protein [Micromonospora carbonacea]|uniref:hypothetical protein n=1 Tax=Micromonospora carbonacea TaxID=47853 RepID=UPI003D70B0B2